MEKVTLTPQQQFQQLLDGNRLYIYNDKEDAYLKMTNGCIKVYLGESEAPFNPRLDMTYSYYIDSY